MLPVEVWGMEQAICFITGKPRALGSITGQGARLRTTPSVPPSYSLDLSARRRQRNQSDGGGNVVHRSFLPLRHA